MPPSPPPFAYSPNALAAGIGPRLSQAADTRQSSELRTSLPPTRARKCARRRQPWRWRWRPAKRGDERPRRALFTVHCPLSAAHCSRTCDAREPSQAVDPGTTAYQICRRRHPHPCVQGGPSPQHSRPPGCSPSSLMPAAISTPSSARLARRGAPNRLCAVVRASNRCRPPWASARAWACEIGRRRKGSYLRHSSQRPSVVAGGPETRFDRTPGPPCSGEAGSRCFVPSGATLYRRPTHQPHTLRNSLYLALRPPSTLLESCAPPWLFRLA